MGERWFISIDRAAVDRNKGREKLEPVISFQQGVRGTPRAAFRLKFTGGEIVYSPHDMILPSGAHVVIETQDEPEIIEG
jgi:hypothetical protein